MSAYAELMVTSNFSFLRSGSHPEELVSAAMAMGLNGIGIAEEYRETIFGIFKRLHTRDQYAGTGMGLAICQRIVERYGGRIWVESERGKGSVFYFTAPR